MCGIGAGHQGLGRRAASVDAGAAEQFALDDGDLLAGLGQPDRERRPRLPGADDDRVERLAHSNLTISKAPPMAHRSSSTAIGQSRPPIALTRRLRASAPPKVPATAPATPAIRPPIQPPPPLRASAVPHSAPLVMRAMKPGGALRLGVFGSLSNTSSTSARTVRM